MHVPQLGEGVKYHSTQNGESNVMLDSEKYKLLNPDFAWTDDQNELIESINITQYRKHGDPWSNGFESQKWFLVSMYSRYLVTKQLMEKVERERKFSYKYIVFLRTDVRFIDRFDIKWFELIKNKNRDFLIPDFHHWDGLNDRFAVSSASLGIQFGLGFEEMLSYSTRKPLHSKKFNEYLIKQKLRGRVTLIPFRFYRVRAKGKIASNDVGNYIKDKNSKKSFSSQVENYLKCYFLFLAMYIFSNSVVNTFDSLISKILNFFVGMQFSMH